ncbi:MAG: hypothetical protein Q8916_11200 [Bacteroidota bacterium]|nr:hypothetical protein [Bacteroidota bacterium]MDP4230957.1 hypothetical protein [Bacteroidota bacterium]MDP4235162.1 hypothetical protein [Bacteroidota bacterium]
MTLVEEFIFALNKTERKKLRPLQFRGVKRKIFLKILSCRASNGIDKEKMMLATELETKRFYQTLSEILRALYHDVAPAGGTQLLQYLGNMQLYRHFYVEMRRQESALKKLKDTKALEDFYFKVLLMSEFFLLPPHRGENIRAELANYLHRFSRIKKPHPSDKCFIRCAEIEEDISRNFMREFSLTKLRASTDELEEIFECLKANDHALAKFKVAYTLITVYFGKYFPDKSPDPYIAYLNSLVDKNADVFGSVTELIKLGCQSYVTPKESDIKAYKKYLSHPHPTGEGSSLLFIERFLPLVVRAGEFAWAKQFIIDHFPINIDQIRKDSAIHWWRLKLIYHVYASEYTPAEKCLHKAFAANTGQYRNTDVDLNLRCYSAFLTIMLDGPEYAADEVTRHIRYAHNHGYNKGEGFMLHYLKAVRSLISQPDFDTYHSEKVRNRYLAELNGEFRLYPLFEKIYREYYY